MSFWRPGFLKKEASHNSTRYEITREGEETLSFFGKNISPTITEDMDQYLKENRIPPPQRGEHHRRLLQVHQSGLHCPL